jgi:hypothetical protein
MYIKMQNAVIKYSLGKKFWKNLRELANEKSSKNIKGNIKD